MDIFAKFTPHEDGGGWDTVPAARIRKSREKVDETFSFLDLNKDGEISPDELGACTKIQVNHQRRSTCNIWVHSPFALYNIGGNAIHSGGLGYLGVFLKMLPFGTAVSHVMKGFDADDSGAINKTEFKAH